MRTGGSLRISPAQGSGQPSTPTTLPEDEFLAAAQAGVSQLRMKLSLQRGPPFAAIKFYRLISNSCVEIRNFHLFARFRDYNPRLNIGYDLHAK
jgi:hypothetical protein